jgi:ADP-ribose pyrophosphatase YjhB (NUDIX family)
MACNRTVLLPSSLDFPRPLASVDVAVFSARAGLLQVLLVKRPLGAEEPFPGFWALPGGFVDTVKDSSLESCAKRKLQEKTGVEASYLEQLGSWGGSSRDPRGWSATHVYFALMSADDVELRPGGNAGDSRWFAVEGQRVKEKLAFDHAEILKAAIARLRSKVEYTSLPAFLMPHEFTLTELQKIYETLLGRPIEKKSFRTRILATDLLEEVARRKAGANRPAQLYRLRNRRVPLFFTRALVAKG